jgi:hypothetical protein
MPRYYFHFRGPVQTIWTGGAIAEAKVVARELRQGRKKSSPEHIVVTNEKGETIHEEPVA